LGTSGYGRGMRRHAALLVTVVLACGGKKKPAPTPPPPPPAKVVEGTLTVDVDPPDAEVEVDGSARGAVSSLTLAPGAHQIVIRKTGFEIWRGEVEIKDQTEKIQVKLVPKK
jgi:PEGA domain